MQPATQRSAEEQFLDQFNHSVPSYLQSVRMENARGAVKALAAAYFQLLPDGPDKEAAVRKLRESLGMATSAIMQGPREAPQSAAPESKPLPLPSSGTKEAAVFVVAHEFTFTALDGTKVTIRKSDAERRYGEHLRRIAELERRLLEYRGDYGDVEGVSY